MRKFYTAILFLASTQVSFGQEFQWQKPDSLYKFVKPVASLQLWGVYTMGEKVQLEENGPLENVQDRLNFMTRRARIGFKGNPYKRLSYKLTIQYDNLGKDRLGAIRGGVNTGSLGILDAYASWRVTNNELLFLTMGYFHPQISRECITGDINVNSFDKSITQSYMRQHVNGKSYGRSTGVNFGGRKKTGIVTLAYNIGVFNNNTTAEYDISESTGKFWSPLIVDRVTLSFGDADQKSYSINYESNNYFNERKGITIGFNSSNQGRTDIFNSNTTTGFDVLINYKNLNFDAEEIRMHRKIEGNSYDSKTRLYRIGYNLIVRKKAFIEPTFTYASFTGDNGATFSGNEESYDVGINWYHNKLNLKTTLHYVFQKGYGDNGLTDETTFRKGDYVGVGWVLLL